MRSGAQAGDRTRYQAGFTLMELLIVISVILILMLMIIPNAANMISHANETSALQSLHNIYNAQIQYQTTYPANGFACSLAALGGDPKTAPTPQAAAILPGDLSGGQKSGYTFNITNCTKVTINNTDQITGYEITAVPQSVGKTGHRGFCMDNYGKITADPAGGTNCTQPIQ